MPQKRFSSGAIREARYDPSEKQLELSFNNGNIASTAPYPVPFGSDFALHPIPRVTGKTELPRNTLRAKQLRSAKLVPAHNSTLCSDRPKALNMSLEQYA